MNGAIKEFLYTRIAELKAQSLLVVGTAPAELTALQDNAKWEVEIVYLQSPEVTNDRTDRYDLGIIFLDHNTTHESWTFLSSARDILTRHLIVVVSNTYGRPASDFLAIGMTKAESACPTDYSIYEYDIATYKTIPDWLSADSWANPEQWEKKRW